MSYFERDALSSTGIKEILKSPAHYQHWWRNQHLMSDKAALRLGSAMHSYVLDDKHSVIVFSETKTAGTRAWDRCVAENPGKIVITEDEHRVAAGMADALLGNIHVSRIIKKCRREQEIYTDLETLDGFIPCKAKLDLRHPRFVIDLKSTGDSAPSFHYSAKKYGYDIQAAWYQYLDWATDKLAGEKKPFMFIVVEKAPPHGIMVYEMNQELIDRAWLKCEEAMRIFAQCIKTGQWPGYSTDIHELSWKEYA